MNDDKLKAIRAALGGETKPPPEIVLKRALSTGATLANLACTDDPFKGYPRGCVVMLIGKSSAGKSVFGSASLAEAAISAEFDKYKLVLDNVEDGALFLDKFYSKKILKRIQPPNFNSNGKPRHSRTAEQFYYHHHKVIEENGRNLYVLDSETALSSDAELKKQKEKRVSIEKSTAITGVMTDSKAKIHSTNLRNAFADCRDTRSILIFLCQSRDAMGFGAKFEPETRSGGRALKFYSHLEIWFSIVGKLYKFVRGKKRQVGVIARLKVKKNRITGKERSVNIRIYYSHGIDDLGSIVDYLIMEEHWKKKKGQIRAPEFDFTGSFDDLIRHIESTNREDDLRRLAGKVWNEIEEGCKVARKSRYL